MEILSRLNGRMLLDYNLFVIDNYELGSKKFWGKGYEVFIYVCVCLIIDVK